MMTALLEKVIAWERVIVLGSVSSAAKHLQTCVGRGNASFFVIWPTRPSKTPVV